MRWSVAHSNTPADNFCQDSLKWSRQKLVTASPHLKFGRPTHRCGKYSLDGSSHSFGSQLDASFIHDSFGDSFKRNTYFHKYLPMRFFQNIIGYFSNARATRFFIRRIVISHSSLGNRTQPATFLSIFLCATSIFSNDFDDSGKIAKPNNIVGVITASNNFKRKEILICRLHKVFLY